jgi:hypothetical protein
MHRWSPVPNENKKSFFIGEIFSGYTIRPVAAGSSYGIGIHVQPIITMAPRATSETSPIIAIKQQRMSESPGWCKNHGPTRCCLSLPRKCYSILTRRNNFAPGKHGRQEILPSSCQTTSNGMVPHQSEGGHREPCAK